MQKPLQTLLTFRVGLLFVEHGRLLQRGVLEQVNARSRVYVSRGHRSLIMSRHCSFMDGAPPEYTRMHTGRHLAPVAGYRDTACDTASMLPRRGYEPVDDGNEDNTSALHETTSSRRSDHTISAEGERSALYLPTQVTENDPIGIDKTKTTISNDDNSTGASGSGSEGDDSGMTIRVLDVRGVFYPLRGLTPETTVRELKLMLVTETGVEIARQRIIHAGKVSGVCVA